MNTRKATLSAIGTPIEGEAWEPGNSSINGDSPRRENMIIEKDFEDDKDNDDDENRPKETETTMTGYIITLIKSRNGKLSESVIIHKVTNICHMLRRADGTKYYGDVGRCVRGCLYSNQVFFRNQQNPDEWCVNEDMAKKFEDRSACKIRNRQIKYQKTAEFKKEAHPLKSALRKSAEGITTLLAKKRWRRKPTAYQSILKSINTLGDYLAKKEGTKAVPVSYTHLTLPTIYSV
eukprot:TRINITY_DN10309_c0_g1_i1.p1 TRINITY_DN10309_c0_g1~~TRINITY_DN10309_c0_g1_i1.p1  ORF type:complete len:234 (-),score=35.84 TRINITY_DN10309_c0_g1_i1:34-735(-)